MATAFKFNSLSLPVWLLILNLVQKLVIPSVNNVTGEDITWSVEGTYTCMNILWGVLLYTIFNKF